jgi:hypothetical protein
MFVVAEVAVVTGIADDINGANFHNYPPSGNLQDEDGHGTHVAGIIGGRGLAGQGMQGIARVRLMTCKALGLRGIGNLSNAVKCIDYALIKGADIIVASWVSNRALYSIIVPCPNEDRSSQQIHFTLNPTCAHPSRLIPTDHILSMILCRAHTHTAAPWRLASPKRAVRGWCL